MDGVGKMYNPGSSPGGERSRPTERNGYYGGGASFRQSSVPEHTEKFYKALRDVPKEPESQPVQDKSAENTPCLSSSTSGGLFSGLGSSLNGITSLLKKLGDDDILLLLMIILLFGENRKDDYPLLIILGILLLT